MYAGAHGRANAVGQLVEAAELLRDRPDILIALVGDGPERAAVEERSAPAGSTNVMVCGPQPKDDMPDFVSACDVRRRGAAEQPDVPDRLSEQGLRLHGLRAADAAGHRRRGAGARVRGGPGGGVRRAGERARPRRRDPKLADSPQLCRELGQRGRAWVLANATREALAERYLDVMQELVGRDELAPSQDRQRGWRLIAKEVVDRSVAAGRWSRCPR